MASYNSYAVILLVSILAGVCYGQDIDAGSVINSGVTIDENGVTIGGSTPSFSGPPLTFECPAGCISQSYSPVIFTTVVAISTLQNSCTCMGCPSGGIVQCTFYQDGEKLEPTDTVLAAVAASAQSTTPAGGTSTTDVISESSGSMLAVWAGIGSVLLLI